MPNPSASGGAAQPGNGDRGHSRTVAHQASGALWKVFIPDWHGRGVAIGIEPQTVGGFVQFPLHAYADSESVPAAARLERLLHVLERQFKAKPVVLIDEYDAPLTHLLGRDMDPDPFIAVLREFFGLLKHLENHLHFVFITGISRFAHVNLFSALNNLKDISWDPDYCGSVRV